MAPSGASWRQTSILAIAGAVAFWLANFVISLTPIAADYRAALSIAYVPMLLAALFGGLVVGVGVSYVLVRYYDAIPSTGAVSKSLVLSSIALVLLTALLEVPARLAAPTSDVLRLLLIGLAFNTVRILALGVVIGYLYARLGRQHGRQAAGRLKV
jgi:hypothetical protein